MKKNENEYTIEQLKINKDTILLENPFMLGIITKCCLGIGATGGNFSLYSILDPNASFVVVKKNGKPISHALMWISNDNKTLVIDSIDPIQNFANDLINENNLLAFLYNDFASEFIQSNPQIKNVNMSLGGNTLKAIQLKKDYPLQTQLYSKKGEQNIIKVNNKNQPTQFCLLQEDGEELKLITKDIDLSDFNIKETNKYNEKLFEININSLLKEFNKQETKDDNLENLLDLLLEVENVITKSTGWEKAGSIKQPTDGDIFSLNDSSIHGVTFNSQMTIQGV